MNGFIYHITNRHDWQSARGKGGYSTESLPMEGFIHCSRWEQVARVANAFFHAKTGLVLLEIDPECLTCELRWEPGMDKADELFPHIYGTLNLEAVQRVLDFPPDLDGSFSLPIL
jgi:uncharacterized protein (DUF952 family)